MNENVVLWGLVVGFFSPLIIAVVQQQAWSTTARAAVMFVISAILGTGTAYFNEEFSGKPIVTTILLVLVTTITTYKGLWKPTDIAPAIERATSGPSTTGL